MFFSRSQFPPEGTGIKMWHAWFPVPVRGVSKDGRRFYAWLRTVERRVVGWTCNAERSEVDCIAYRLPGSASEAVGWNWGKRIENFARAFLSGTVKTAFWLLIGWIFWNGIKTIL